MPRFGKAEDSGSVCEPGESLLPIKQYPYENFSDLAFTIYQDYVIWGFVIMTIYYVMKKNIINHLTSFHITLSIISYHFIIYYLLFYIIVYNFILYNQSFHIIF